MFDNQFAQQTDKSDVFKLLNLKQNPETIQQQQILTTLRKYHQKVEAQILQGNLQVLDRHTIKEQMMSIQKERLKMQAELQIAQNSHKQGIVKDLRKQLIKLRQQEIMLAKQQAKIKKKEVLQNVRKWEEIQKQIKLKKEAEDSLKAKKQNQLEMITKLRQEEQQYLRRLQKKKKIQQKLKQIQKNRAKREEIIHYAQIEYTKLHPKFIAIEQKFKKIDQETKLEEELLKKNNKIPIKIDYGAIKAHQKQYMAKVEERKRKLSQMRASSVEIRPNQEFTPFLYRNQAKIEEERQKFKRRIEFQQNLKKIHKIRKYQVKELPSIALKERITKSQSLHTLTHSSQKSELSEKASLKKDRLTKKSKILPQLAKNEKKNPIELGQPEQKQKYNVLKVELRKVQQIDEIYQKSIKAKLVQS